jgi:hypothetical protein
VLAFRRILYGATTVILVLLVSLAGLEIGLRIYSLVKPNADIEFYRYAKLMKAAAPGSGMGFRHEPGTSLRLFRVDVEIDGRGFRDIEGGFDGSEDVVRVGLLGDSITFGWGVPYGDRFSEIIEREWSGAGPERFELLNTGHGNYGTVQELAVLRELLADEPLDGVIQV